MIATVNPGVSMRNSQRPSGLKVAPANSLVRKSPAILLRSPLSTTLLRAKRTILPSRVRPQAQAFGGAVFAQDEAAARADDQVVRHVQYLRARRFVGQAEVLVPDVESHTWPIFALPPSCW
ncbi:MAG: hypothetical protein Q8O42_00025 [Acidobacteriota bacterium]|nr:hypothetical protein [Acidobacteriota bacterium]